MTEIDKLAQLDDVQTGVGDGDYEPPSEFPRPADAGEYLLMRVEENDKDYLHGRFITRDGQGAAWFNFRAQIQGGPFAGRYVSGGCNTLVSTFRKGSSADDFIRSAKASVRPRTIREWEDAIPRIIGPFTGRVDWEWTCMDCKDENDKPITFLRGQRNPRKPKKYDGPIVKVAKDASGATPHVVKCPECGQDVGARAIITTFVVRATGTTTTAATKSAPAPENLPPSAG